MALQDFIDFILAKSPWGFWAFDAASPTNGTNLPDLSGNGRNATVAGTGCSGVDPITAGASGAIRFVNGNGNASLPSTPALGKCSIGGFVRFVTGSMPDDDGNGWQHILCGASTADFIHFNSNQFTMEIDSATRITDPSDVPADEGVFFVVTRDDDNNLHLYRDGELVAGPTAYGGIFSAGMWGSAAFGSYAAEIELNYCFLFDGVCLTAEEVENAYTLGTGGSIGGGTVDGDAMAVVQAAAGAVIEGIGERPASDRVQAAGGVPAEGVADSSAAAVAQAAGAAPGDAAIEAPGASVVQPGGGGAAEGLGDSDGAAVGAAAGAGEVDAPVDAHAAGAAQVAGAAPGDLAIEAPGSASGQLGAGAPGDGFGNGGGGAGAIGAPAGEGEGVGDAAGAGGAGAAAAGEVEAESEGDIVGAAASTVAAGAISEAFAEGSGGATPSAAAAVVGEGDAGASGAGVAQSAGSAPGEGEGAASGGSDAQTGAAGDGGGVGDSAAAVATGAAAAAPAEGAGAIEGGASSGGGAGATGSATGDAGAGTVGHSAAGAEGEESSEGVISAGAIAQAAVGAIAWGRGELVGAAGVQSASGAAAATEGLQMYATPASLDDVYAAAKRLQPPVMYSTEDGSSVLRELRALSRVFARVVDVADRALPAQLLQAADLLSQWERLLRIASRPGDTIATRAARIQGVVRRRLGYDRARLAAVLAPAMGIAPDEVVWLEVRRSDIEPGLLHSATTGGAIPVGANALRRRVDVPWPGKVDGGGLRLSVDITVADPGDVSVSVVHANGLSWTPWAFAPGGPNLVRTWSTHVFQGAPARGPWQLVIADPSGASGTATLNVASLFVSNEVDSGQIFRGYCMRPVALGMTSDLGEAQRLLDFAGVGHVRAAICERASCRCDDPRSLTDREPVG